MNKNVLDIFKLSPLAKKVKTEKRMGVLVINRNKNAKDISKAGRSEIINANKKAHQIFGFEDSTLIGKPLNFVFQRVEEDCYCIDRDYSFFGNKGVVVGEIQKREDDKHIWARTKNDKPIELRVFYINDPVHELLGVFFCSYVKGESPKTTIENTEIFCELRRELTEEIKALELDYRLKKNFENLLAFWKKTAIALISVMFVPSIGLGLLTAGVQGNKYGEQATPLYEQYLEEPLKREVDSRVRYKKFKTKAENGNRQQQ